MKKVVRIIVLIVGVLTFNNIVYAKSGCCSWHKGVSGCGSNGRIICNDGTYSPSCTCTPPKVYGCTDWEAMNYNSNANTDNGSCRYQRKVSETIILDYGIEYQNPNNIENGKETVIQSGKKGSKVITYQVITDKNGTELSREKISEAITTQPVNQIILIEAIPLEIEDTSNTHPENNKEKINKQADNNSAFLLIIFILFIFNMIKVKTESKNFPILHYIRNINNLTLKYISYFVYFVFIFPIIIDLIIYIIYIIKR